jgi:predicted nuclease of predicted toxin-antitoxin system
VRVLVDEMFPASVARQLRARGHDAVSAYDADVGLAGASDEDVFATAVTSGRALVTENVPDFRRLEAAALAAGEAVPIFVFTTNRQFPRGHARTLGRVVAALDALLRSRPDPVTALFLKPARRYQ